MILRILLLLQMVLGVIGCFGAMILQGENRSFWAGLGAALIITGGALFLVDFFRRSRKLSDKDKRTVVGVIERKAELRRQRRKNAGYMTFLASGYCFTIAFLTVLLGGLPILYLKEFGIILFAQGILFWILYQIERLRSDE